MVREDYYKIADVSAGVFGAFVYEWQGLLVRAAKEDPDKIFGVEDYDSRIYPLDTSAKDVWRSTMKKIGQATAHEKSDKLCYIEFTCLQVAMLRGFIMHGDYSTPALREAFSKLFTPWFQMSKGWSRCIHEMLPCFDKKELLLCINDMERRLDVLRDSIKELHE